MGQHQIPTAYEKQIVALGRVLQTLREEENADVLIETTLNYLQSEFSYRLIWIGLYDRLDHRLFGKGGFTPNGDTTLLKQRFFLNPGDLLEQVVIQQRPVGVPDLREETRAGEWRRAAQQFGIQGTLLFPLRCKDRCFGVAMLGSHLWGVSPRVIEKAQLSLLFGGLAAALYQIEVDWQRSSTKRPDQPLFQVLEQMIQLPTMQQRLETVVNMTQQFVAPTRTNIYWFEPTRRYFWHRVGNRQIARGLGDALSSAAGITVQEVNEFYQALADGNLVAIGSGRSPLKADVTGRLLSRLKARSVLAGPIKVRDELVGFLAAEGNEPRIWEDAEKNYVRAVAQLVALASGNEDLETALLQNQKYTYLVAEVAEILYGNSDRWVALKLCSELILERFGVERLALLQEVKTDKQPVSYTPIYQHQPNTRRLLPTNIGSLTANDRQLLEKSPKKIVAVQDWEEDKQLPGWREPIGQLGVRSLLLSRVSGTTTPERLLLVGHHIPRTWNQTECRLLNAISQQIGAWLASQEFSSQSQSSSLAQEALQTGLRVLLAAPAEVQLLEEAGTAYLASVVGSPLVVLISWTPQAATAQVNVSVATTREFALSGKVAISAVDPLLQEVMASQGTVSHQIDDLAAGTRRWLNNPNIGQIMAVNASIPNTETLLADSHSIILFCDQSDRQWPVHLLPVLNILAQQFAWFRYYRRLSATKDKAREDLETLNWYKHRCLEAFHQAVGGGIARLLELESQDPGQVGDVALKRMRSSQILHQMENTLEGMRSLLNEEQSQLVLSLRPVPLENLLKRTMRRVDTLIQERQITPRVYNSGNFSVYGDRLKLECILFELLVNACSRSQTGGRIDLWCIRSNVQESKGTEEAKTSERETAAKSKSPQPILDLLIVDNGAISANFLSALQAGDISQAISELNIHPAPTSQLQICQRVLHSWGGEVLFYQLSDGYLFSRLILRMGT